jgi:plasmid stability protein
MFMAEPAEKGDVTPRSAAHTSREILPTAVLSEQHRQLKKLAADLTAMTQQVQVSDTEAFGRLRLAISRALQEHFEAEDRVLGHAMWSKSGMPATLLADWDRRRQQFRMAYSQHLRDWTLADATRDWAGYGKAVALRIGEAETLAQFEETQIYPLARDG